MHDAPIFYLFYKIYTTIIIMRDPFESLGPYLDLVDTGQIEARDYQINIAKSIYSGANTLVVLPTGLGKTLIGIFAIAKALSSGKKAIILAPTKPLSEQHYASLSKLLKLNASEISILTGSMPVKERKEREESARVIAATPQTIANDLRSGRFSLKEFGLIIFDECHRAVGRYAYTYIADEGKLGGVQLIGLTASPGSDRKKIGELVNVLGIEDIEIRVSTDPDVAPYVMGKQVAVEYVEKGNVIDSIRGILKPVIDIHIGNLFKRGLVYTRDFEKLPKRVLLEVGDNINKIQAVNYRFAAFFDYVYVLNLVHAYDLLSTEGLYSFISYFDSLNAREKKSRAVKSILSDGEVSKALRLAKDAEADGDEHPKMFKLAEIVGGTFRGKSVIVFAQYRSTIKKIAEVLVKNGIKAAVFIGKGEGITQSKQKQVIDEFRNRNFDVLVATSIGEEGLDIPSVDAVIFYEPIPSEIRNIQRKGRAGRVKFGDVVILVTVGTKDEAYLMVSRIKERRMKDLVMKMKNELAHRALSDRYNSSQRKL